MPTTEFNDRHLALKYIKDRGYVSHSSLRRYINGEAPPSNSEGSEAQVFGKELHSRFLENKKLAKMAAALELLCKAMITALITNRIVNALMKNVKTELEWKVKIFGVWMLGYYDILGVNYVADLKTTRHTSMAAFANSLDFLQAAIYLEATGFKDFWYIGITKTTSPKVLAFNVREYPEKLKSAQAELKTALKMLKKDLEAPVKKAA